MTPDDGSTERCENSCVGASGDGRYEYDHVWSRGRTDIRFGSRYDVSDGAILKTWKRAQGSGREVHLRTHSKNWVSDASTGYQKTPLPGKYPHSDCKRRNLAAVLLKSLKS